MSARFGKPVPAGFIYQMTDDVVFRFGMCEPLLSEARAALSSLQSMIEKEIFPPATPIRARCTDCEYRNFCGDVF